MPTIGEEYYAKWERFAGEQSKLLERILTEMTALNKNFDNYHREWKEIQVKTDRLQKQAQEAMKMVKEGRGMDKEVTDIFKQSTKNMSPEEVASIMKSGPELVKLGKRMMEEKDKEDAEWHNKLKGSR